MATEYASDVDMSSFDFSTFLQMNSTLRTLFPFSSDKGPVFPLNASKDTLPIYGTSKPTNMVAALKTAFKSGNHTCLRITPNDARFSGALIGLFASSEPMPGAVNADPNPNYFLGIAPFYSADDFYDGTLNVQDLSPIYREGGLPLNIDKYNPEDALQEAGDNFYNANNMTGQGTGSNVPAKTSTRLIEPLAIVYRNGPADEDDVAIKITSDNVVKIPPAKSSIIFKGGNLQAGTYKYLRVPVTANGAQFDASSDSYSVTLTPTNVTAGERAIQIEWDLDDPSVRGILIYRDFGTERRLVGQLSRISTTFIDDTQNQGEVVDTTSTSNPFTSTRSAISPDFMMQVYNTTSGTLLETIPFSFNTELRDSEPLPIDEAINTISENLLCKRLYEFDRIQGKDVPILYSTPTVPLKGAFNGVNEIGQADLQRVLKPFLNRDRYRITSIVDLGFCSQWAFSEFAKVCDAQRAHALLGMPKAFQSAQAGVSFASSLVDVGRRQSIFTPWMYRRDPDTQSRTLVLGSAFACQAMLFSDAATTGGAGRAFAGMNRGVVDALGVEIPDQYEYDDTERDLMAKGKVNYFRKKPNVGMTLWEQFTLQRNLSAASYINVSRLWDIIQNSIHDYLEWSLYEPNDDFTVKEVRGGLKSYLADHIRNRNLSRAEVIMDGGAGNNNSTADEGIRLIDVYLTPVIPTRRFKCRTILTRQGATYEDLMQVM